MGMNVQNTFYVGGNNGHFQFNVNRLRAAFWYSTLSIQLGGDGKMECGEEKTTTVQQIQYEVNMLVSRLAN